MSIEVRERHLVTDRDRITVHENNLVDLQLEDGEIRTGLEPHLLFPVSNENEYITLLYPDGREAALIRKLSDLNEVSRKVIQASLRYYYLVPVILKVFSITEKSGTLIWQVETNRGKKQFEVSDRNHDIRANKDGCVRIKDSADNRYIIKNYHELDRHSICQMMSDL